MTTEKNLKVSAIICAAGKGERAGFGKNKLLCPLYGAPALYHTLEKFDIPEIDEVIIASSAFDYEEICALAAPFGYKVTIGGKTRTESVKNALGLVTGDIVLVHDGARPFVSKKLICDCIDSVERYGSGVCALPVTDAIAGVHYGVIAAVPDRDALKRLQTPQGFMTALLRRAYSLAGEKNYPDDSSLYTEFVGRPRIVDGEEDNVKLTYKKDFLREFPPVLPPEGQRIGLGADVHAFKEGNKVTLGGVDIPCDRGLLAHSDGDVVMHALCDALLSAAGLKDIGHYFPVNDPAYEGADSCVLLQIVIKEVKKCGYAPLNLSVSVQAERPRLAAYIDKMKQKIAEKAEIPAANVAVAAGTCEGLGFVGKGLGIAAYAIALLGKADK